MSELRSTPLHSIHVESKAKMVDFGGWHMPLQYEGILAEHKMVREQVGLFDVSHMGEIDFVGPGAVNAVQSLVTNDVARLVDNQALYTAVCYPDGGIVDDCIVYRFQENHLRIVVNASNIEKDEAFFREHAQGECDIQNLSENYGLIAVQGPKARALCAELGGAQLLEVPSFGMGQGTIAGKAFTAARTGYTGEDGFELFVSNEDAPAIWTALTQAGAKPAGLGARDTLRLEARLCLYGNDIDETTDPYSAGLGWTVKLDSGDFVGKAALTRIKAEGPSRRLVGFAIQGRGIARAGAELLSPSGQAIGKVTSGSAGPTVGTAIGMGYIDAQAAKEIAADGGELQISQRGKTLAAKRVKGPFYRRPA